MLDGAGWVLDEREHEQDTSASRILSGWCWIMLGAGWGWIVLGAGWCRMGAG